MTRIIAMMVTLIIAASCSGNLTSHVSAADRQDFKTVKDGIEALRFPDGSFDDQSEGEVPTTGAGQSPLYYQRSAALPSGSDTRGVFREFVALAVADGWEMVDVSCDILWVALFHDDYRFGFDAKISSDSELVVRVASRPTPLDPNFPTFEGDATCLT